MLTVEGVHITFPHVSLEQTKKVIVIGMNCFERKVSSCIQKTKCLYKKWKKNMPNLVISST